MKKLIIYCTPEEENYNSYISKNNLVEIRYSPSRSLYQKSIDLIEKVSEILQHIPPQFEEGACKAIEETFRREVRSFSKNGF